MSEEKQKFHIGDKVRFIHTCSIVKNMIGIVRLYSHKTEEYGIEVGEQLLWSDEKRLTDLLLIN